MFSIDSFPNSQHYHLAQFLCFNSHAAEAVLIKTLSPVEKIKICSEYKLYDTLLSFIPDLITHAKSTNQGIFLLF